MSSKTDVSKDLHQRGSRDQGNNADMPTHSSNHVKDKEKTDKSDHTAVTRKSSTPQVNDTNTMSEKTKIDWPKATGFCITGSSPVQDDVLPPNFNVDDFTGATSPDPSDTSQDDASHGKDSPEDMLTDDPVSQENNSSEASQDSVALPPNVSSVGSLNVPSASALQKTCSSSFRNNTSSVIPPDDSSMDIDLAALRKKSIFLNSCSNALQKNNPEPTSEEGTRKTFEIEVPPMSPRHFGNVGHIDEDNSMNNLLVERMSVVVPPNILDAFTSKRFTDNGSDCNGSVTRDDNSSIFKLPSLKDKYGKVELYAPDIGPKMYPVKGNIVTPPIITKNLPEVFRALPVHGKTESKADLEEFTRQKIRDYIGYGIDDNEFEKLEEFCSPEYLKTGEELAVTYSFPAQGSLPVDLRTVSDENGPGSNLCIVKKLKLRKLKDKQNHYPRKLKYRGLRLLPLAQEEEDESAEMSGNDEALVPGKDLIYRVRVYRPHSYGNKDQRPNRHSVFANDIVLIGRQKLTVLRDRLGCPNDIGMRIDISDNPNTFCTESAKRVFPSGFLFINNVFYVDRRPGCLDHSAVIREWAARRELGSFPVADMGAVSLERLVLRLGHPEVYMHQGKCEHLFTFSEIRLLGASDPLRLSLYPLHTAIAQNQSVYCTTCAEFAAKWVVVGCDRVPFDPAFFCETCFKLYLYDKEGKKIGNFKAYSFRGNTINFLKPVAGLETEMEAMSGEGGKRALELG